MLLLLESATSVPVCFVPFIKKKKKPENILVLKSNQIIQSAGWEPHKSSIIGLLLQTIQTAFPAAYHKVTSVTAKERNIFSHQPKFN